MTAYELFKRGFNTQEIMVMLGLSSEAEESRRKKSEAAKKYWSTRRQEMREARAGA